MEGLGSWLSTESLLAIRGAQKNTPTLACAHEVVRCVETRGLLLAPLDLPFEVRDAEVLALGDERDRLEFGRDVAVVSIELAQGDHILANRLKRWPMRIPRVARDARRDGVQ